MVTFEIDLRVRFPIDDEVRSELHRRAFGGSPGAPGPWAERLQRHSLTWVGAFDANDLVGFVHLCWDGGAHGFVLDTMSIPITSDEGSATVSSEQPRPKVNEPVPLRGCSIVDGFDTALLQVLQVVAHALEHLRGVPLPVEDFTEDS